MENTSQVHALSGTPAVVLEQRKRRARWHSFQVIFGLLYSGILLDIITTSMGFQKAGSGYEQNPLGGFLIGNLGWVGLAVVLSAFAGVLYLSCRVLFLQVSSRRTGWLSGVLAAATFVRWVAVVTAVMFIVQPH